MKPIIVGIRFQRVGKIYHFDSSGISDLQVGDYVVVDTIRGRQLGEIVQLVDDPAPSPDGSWKPIRRRANPRDLVLRQLWQKKELEATLLCRESLAKFRVPGVKIITSEYSFDGTRLSFFYSTEGEAKVDLKNLRAAMQRQFPKAKVEMHQIGPRDVAKLLGGMGACGLENRCCSMFLTDFSPISIKMAKEQGISLTPSEITGICGRLRCCLVYEYEQYLQARKELPKRNKRVVTPQGEGKVVDIYPLKSTVVVELDSGNQAEFPSQDLQPWDELEALRRKAEGPCPKNTDGDLIVDQESEGNEVEPGSLAEESSGTDHETPAVNSARLEPYRDRPERFKKKSGQGKSAPQKSSSHRDQTRSQSPYESPNPRKHEPKPKKKP
jgi:cell fate regulator YaaT (PSP1 superfamily)